MNDKVLPLGEAVRRHVRPGMTLHFDIGPRAAIRSVLRQFWGKDPRFTLAVVALGRTHTGDLLHAGLVKKVIAASCVENFPRAGPMKVVQRAYTSRSVEFEHWSDCSIIQRFMAGAMGLGFVPTTSILGSTMESANAALGTFRAMDDPFGSGQRIGLAKALNPDVSFVHAVAADPMGNAIVLGSDENLWGAKASRGVIVSTEKLVTTDFIRSHSYLTALPAHMALAVCPTPFGAHPGILNNFGFDEFDTYIQDDDYLRMYAAAVEAPEKLDQLIKEWVLSCADHEAYLKKLGDERLSRLKTQARVRRENRERIEMSSLAVPSEPAGEYSNAEMMVVASYRKAVETMTRKGFDRILLGVGVGLLAGECAYLTLTGQGRLTTLITGTTGLGQQPVVHRASRAVADFTMLHNTVEGYAVHVGGHTKRCLAILGAGQIDRFGNINTSEMSETTFLTGSGGGNDASSQAAEVFVIGRQSTRRMVDKVHYITSSGARVSTCVTDFGIFEKETADGELLFTGYYPRAGRSAEDIVKDVQAGCGWKVRVSPRLAPVSAPTPQELALVRALDPERLYLRE